MSEGSVSCLDRSLMVGTKSLADSRAQGEPLDGRSYRSRSAYNKSDMMGGASIQS